MFWSEIKVIRVHAIAAGSGGPVLVKDQRLPPLQIGGARRGVGIKAGFEEVIRPQFDQLGSEVDSLHGRNRTTLGNCKTGVFLTGEAERIASAFHSQTQPKAREA